MKKFLFQLTLLLLVSGCSRSNYPLDINNNAENYEMQQEYEEGKLKAERHDEYLDAKWDEYSETASAELYEYDEPSYDVNNYSGTASGCPFGCTYHKEGCDIKGNISFNTHEKIYHLPWQKYYDETIINSDYGERWFCTEEEAKSNGWRISKQ